MSFHWKVLNGTVLTGAIRSGSTITKLPVAHYLGTAAMLVLALMPNSIAFEDDMEKTGFSPSHVLASSAEDNIDLYSGNLSFSVPIFSISSAPGFGYSVALTYNSKVWSLADRDGTVNDPIKIKPIARSEVGLGWRIRTARIWKQKDDSNCQSCANAWSYEDESGNISSLAEIPSGSDTYYTLDNTWIKAKRYHSSGSTTMWEAWKSDGRKLTFQHQVQKNFGDHGGGGYVAEADGNTRGWYVTQVDSADGLHHIYYTYDSAKRYSLTSVRDELNRQVDFISVTTIQNSDTNSSKTIDGGYITEIRYPRFASSAKAVCTLSYSMRNLSITQLEATSSHDFTSGSSGDNTLLLTGISCPSGVTHSFSYDADGSLTGELKRRTQPTGAAIDYEYRTYDLESFSRNAGPRDEDCDPGSCHGALITKTSSRGVTKKSITGTDIAAPHAQVWEYTRTITTTSSGGICGAGQHETQVSATVLKDPFGNATKSTFFLTNDETKVGFNGSLVSTGTYEGDVDGTLKRSDESHFTSDGMAGLTCSTQAFQKNIRSDRQVTRYSDTSPEMASKIEYADWDSYGHYRQKCEYALFQYSNDNDLSTDFTMCEPTDTPGPYRRTVTAYNCTQTDSATCTANPATDTLISNWVLNTYDYTAVQDLNSGSWRTLRFTDYTFGTQAAERGKILTSRAYLNPNGLYQPTPTATGDVLVTWAYNSSTGYPTSKTESFADGSSSRQATFTFSSGRVSQKKFTGKDWWALDRDIDGSTGRVSAERDTAGIQTGFEWDDLGRLTKINLASTELDTVISYPSLKETVVTRTKTSGTDYTEERYFYDDLARVKKKSRRINGDSGPVTAYQCTGYDAAGRAATESVWSTSSSCSGAGVTETAYSPSGLSTGPFDPLGRVRRLRLPDYSSDGTTKETTTSYSGLTKSVTISGIRTWTSGTAGWTSSRTDYTTDAFGRLAQVTPINVGVDAAIASYSYDANNQLTTVDVSHGTLHQLRTFTYDKLGRNTSATNPENGLVTTNKFDPRGNALEITDARGTASGYTFKSTFDVADRLLTTDRIGDGTPDFSFTESSTGWTANTKWHLHDSTMGCGLPAFSGSKAWYFGDETGACTYGGGTAAATLVSPQIAGIDKLTTLSFMYWRETRSTVSQSGEQDFDTFSVFVLSGSGFSTVTKVFSLDSDDESWSSWRSSGPIDLAGFEGQTIQIKFEFDPSYVSTTTSRGILLDDIAVKSSQSLRLSENVFHDTTGQSNCSGRGSSLGKLCTSRGYMEEAVLRSNAWTSRQVSERNLYYGGLNGRVSREDVALDPEGDGVFDTFTFNTGWNDWGLDSSLDYPVLSGSPAHHYDSTVVNGALKDFKDAAGGTIVSSVTYNLYGGPKKTSFGNGTSSLVTPDSQGRPLSIDFTDAYAAALMATGTYKFDGAGNIFEIGNDRYYYDQLNRLDYSSFPASDYVDNGYDAWGNMTLSYSPQALSEMNFSGRSYSGTSGGVPDNRVHDGGWAYDENGNLLSEPATVGGRAEYRYQFDSRSRLKAVTAQPSSGDSGYADLLAEFQYEQGGERASKMRWANGGELSLYIRDASGRLLSEFVKKPGAGISLDKEFLYANGALISSNVVCGPAPILGLANPSWASGAFQFTLAQAQGSPSSTGGFNLDIRTASGQHRVVWLAASTGSSFVVVDANFFADETNYVRIETLGECGGTGYSNEVSLFPVTSSPPGPGCLKKAYVFKPTLQNTLTLGAEHLCGGTYQYNFYYKPEGQSTWHKINSAPLDDRRLTLTEVPGSAATATYQVRRVSGGQEDETGPNVHPSDATGGPAGSSSWPNGAPAVTIRYYQADHLASTRRVTDSLGNVLERFDYYPFGSLRGTSSGTDSNRLFTGHERDLEIGLDYMLAREYSPHAGRFLSVDPIGDVELGDGSSWNAYLYVRDNPIAFRDPRGLQAAPTMAQGGRDPATGFSSVDSPSPPLPPPDPTCPPDSCVRVIGDTPDPPDPPKPPPKPPSEVETAWQYARIYLYLQAKADARLWESLPARAHAAWFYAGFKSRVAQNNFARMTGIGTFVPQDDTQLHACLACTMSTYGPGGVMQAAAWGFKKEAWDLADPRPVGGTTAASLHDLGNNWVGIGEAIKTGECQTSCGGAP